MRQNSLSTVEYNGKTHRDHLTDRHRVIPVHDLLFISTCVDLSGFAQKILNLFSLVTVTQISKSYIFSENRWQLGGVNRLVENIPSTFPAKNYHAGS